MKNFISCAVLMQKNSNARLLGEYCYRQMDERADGQTWIYRMLVESRESNITLMKTNIVKPEAQNDVLKAS